MGTNLNENLALLLGISLRNMKLSTSSIEVSISICRNHNSKEDGAASLSICIFHPPKVRDLKKHCMTLCTFKES
jgi:hypothetical protein